MCGFLVKTVVIIVFGQKLPVGVRDEGISSCSLRNPRSGVKEISSCSTWSSLLSLHSSRF
uniref:Uncharacterized protein n=1 Tax=Arundo donax TaxID=35708 RepID=A0A0A9A284_ARUDO